MKRNFMGREQGNTQVGKLPSSPTSLGYPHDETQRTLWPRCGSSCPFQTPRSQGRRAGPALGTAPSLFRLPVCTAWTHALGHISLQIKAEGMMHVDP